MKINLSLLVISMTLVIVTVLLSNINFVQSVLGDDIIIELSKEDYALLQQQIGFIDGSVSRGVCNQDFCNFTITMNRKDGVKQEFFNIPSKFNRVTIDGDGKEIVEESTYTVEEFEIVQAGLVKDFLLNQIVIPQKEEEKDKDNYIDKNGGSLIIKEKKK